jgi:hypothetical protein
VYQSAWTKDALSALGTKHSRTFISGRWGAAAYEDHGEKTGQINDTGLCRSRCGEGSSPSQSGFARLATLLWTCNRRVHRLVLFRTASWIQQSRDYTVSYFESRRLSPGTINLRLAAIRRLAYEATDSGLLSPEQAAGIRRVSGELLRGPLSPLVTL